MKLKTSLALAILAASVIHAIPVRRYALVARKDPVAGAAAGDLKPTGPDGKCGNGLTCLGYAQGTCCSKYGFCGSTDAHCGTGCNKAFGTCGSSSQGADIPSTTNPSVSVPDVQANTKEKSADGNNPSGASVPVTPVPGASFGSEGSATGGAGFQQPGSSETMTPPTTPPLVESPAKSNNGTSIPAPLDQPSAPASSTSNGVPDATNSDLAGPTTTTTSSNVPSPDATGASTTGSDSAIDPSGTIKGASGSTNSTTTSP